MQNDTQPPVADAMENFDADQIGVANGNYFGLPFSPADARLVLIPVPWDVTVSYGEGTARAPQAILDASLQVDLFDADHPGEWRQGIATDQDYWLIGKLSKARRKSARRVIRHLEQGGSEHDDTIARPLAAVNEESKNLNGMLCQTVREYLRDGKLVGIVGGDHSTPYGAIAAIAERHPGLGILHIDAHADLRDGYEGFRFSHASIMRRASELPNVSRIVQVGVRDQCEAEASFAASSGGLIVQFCDAQLAATAFGGRTWAAQCGDIVAALPQEVYVSFDIDGLSPDNCPSTGTPVPGGLSFREAVYLLETVATSGRRIVGFDLCEVGHEEFDASIGARVLFKLCNLAVSETLARPNP